MSREYNYGGTSLIVDSIEEIFESGAVSTKTVNNIKQIIGQQRQSKDINKLKEQISGAAEDGTISASEKPGLTREWASLESSYATISNRFEQDENLSDNTFFYLLKANYEALSPIMGEILADMNSDYTNKDKVSQITDLFVACWDYIAKCSKYIEDRMSLSDRFSLQVSANREIVSSLSVSLKLLCYIDGSYIDVTYNAAYADSDFVWRKASDENFSRTGRTLNLTLADFSKEEESFLVSFRHVSHYEDANNTEFVVEKSLDFSVRTGTLSQWAWSDAETKESLFADPFKVWTTDRTESNGKKYLWRRDTKDVLKADNEKEWTYFRESGLNGTIGKDGYSRAQLTLYKRSASGEPTKDDLGTITYTFATNAYAGELGGWSKTIPTGTGDIYAIYASALFDGETDTISPNEWTTPAKLSTEGAKGEDGMSIYTIILFKRSASVPSTPSGNVSYNFHNNVLSGADGWHREIPTSDGNPLYAITATAATRDESDIIYPSEWSAPSIYVVDGKDGKDGEKGEPAEYLEVSCKPQFYTLNGRGVNDKEQAIDVTINRTFIPIENPCYIKVSTYKDDAIVDTGEWKEHNASSTYRIQIPMYITYDRIIVEVSCGTWNNAISIDAVISESKNGEKQLGVVYLHNNKLYKDADHTQEITHLNDNLAKPFIDGDYALVLIGEDLIPYRYTYGTWTALSSDITNGQDYANIMLDTLVDVFSSGVDVKKSMSAHYAFIGQLAAQTATIQNIFSKHIKVLDGGAIYGGSYNEMGNNKDNSAEGFYLDSKGTLKANKASFSSAEIINSTINEAIVSGSFFNKHFRTVEAGQNASSIQFAVTSPSTIDGWKLNLYLGNYNEWPYPVSITVDNVHYSEVTDGEIAKGLGAYVITIKNGTLYYRYAPDAADKNESTLLFSAGQFSNYQYKWEADWNDSDYIPLLIQKNRISNTFVDASGVTRNTSDLACGDIFQYASYFLANKFQFEGSLSYTKLNGVTNTFSNGWLLYSNGYLYVYDSNGSEIDKVKYFTSFSIDVNVLLGKDGIEVENIVPIQDKKASIGTETKMFKDAHIQHIYGEKVYGAVFN